MTRLLRTSLALALAAGAATVLVAAPAHAVPRVEVRNDRGGRDADATYQTALTVTGSGFQSVKGGFGGVYVMFGWVDDRAGGSWRPSRGGVTGSDYRYIPDAEDAAANQGYLTFVAFPGSSTAGEANAVMSGSGRFELPVTVPGPVFESVDRTGEVSEIDCLEVTCGIITIGAHGVKSPANETFTPVAFGEVYAAAPATDEAPADDAADPAPAPAPATVPAPTGTPAAVDAGAGAEPDDGGIEAGAPVVLAAPTLLTDRATAVAGRALAFTGQGFAPGEQVLAILDDGVAAHGPMVAGAAGEVAGLLQLPADLGTGTHELRLNAAASGAQASELFPVQAAASNTVPVVVQESRGTAAGPLFLGGAALALLVALALAVRRSRRRPAGAPA